MTTAEALAKLKSQIDVTCDMIKASDIRSRDHCGVMIPAHKGFGENHKGKCRGRISPTTTRFAGFIAVEIWAKSVSVASSLSARAGEVRSVPAAIASVKFATSALSFFHLVSLVCRGLRRAARALAALKEIPDSDHASALRALAGFAVERSH